MLNKTKFEKFIPIQKIDEEERMVYGYASTPDLDSDGEIIKLEAMERALPGYLAFPTIREMHQAKAAGKTTYVDMRKGDNTQKAGMYIGAKIVAAEAWNLVKEGVYKGFSIGGNVVKRMGNIIEELDLVEISLVDVPANKQATIEVWKKDKSIKVERAKLLKNAYQIMWLADCLVALKDNVDLLLMQEKDATALKSAVESVKSTIALLTREPEIYNFESNSAEWDDEVAMARFADCVKSLEAVSFTEGSQEEIKRKGVIQLMKDKLKKEDTTEEKEEVVTEEKPVTEETKEEVTPETKEVVTEEATVEEKKEETVETTETPVEEKKEEVATEEVKTEEKSVEASTLQKLQDVEKTLEKVAPVAVEVKKEEDLTKAVEAQTNIIVKMATTIEELNKRVKSLENQPAATKSKSALVLKAKEEEEKAEKTVTPSKELEVKKGRLAELHKIYDSIGADKFASQGFSMEAGTLEKEIAELEDAVK